MSEMFGLRIWEDGAHSVIPAGESAGPASRTIPYNRRVLLKGLLRTIAMSSYAPGSTARPQVRSNALMVGAPQACMPQAFALPGQR